MRLVASFFAALPLLVTRARLSLLLHLAQLLLAAVVLAPLSSAFVATFGSSVAGAETAAGRFLESAWQDFHLHQAERLDAAGRTFSAIALLGTFLSFTLLSGGAFAVLVPPGERASLRGFLAGAGRLFARFARLFVLYAAGAAALHFANLGLTLAVNRLVAEQLDRAVSSRTIALLLHGKTAIALLLLGWLVAATGLAKARAARLDDRSAVRCWLAGWRLVLRHPFSSVLLAAIGPLLLAAVVGAYALARDRFAGGATVELAGRSVPTWIAYAVVAQLAGIVMQAGIVVWTRCFLACEAAASARAVETRPPPAPLPAEPVVVPAAAAAALLLLVASARAQDAPGLPAGPFPASYRITATLDPAAKTVAGAEEVVFRNLGDAPVSELGFHLYMNAFAGRDTLWMRERSLRTGKDPLAGLPESALGRCTIERVTVGGTPLEPRIDETVMRIALPEAVAPGGEARLVIAFTTRFASAQLTGRGGFLGDHFDGMQWYPKLGVLKDGAIDCEPFHADTEFFADFGDYDVTLVTPSAHVVGATGRLVETTNGTQASRRFVATAVHDFAWCSDPEFVVFRDEFEYPGHAVAITYLCQPYAVEKSALVLEVVKRCLARYGEWFTPYPYDTLTIDGVPMGLGGGMEYPTLFTISQPFPNHLPWLVRNTEEPASVTAHEFGHQYWYGLLASDERREAWLDEGVNTYVTTKLEQDFWQSRTSGGRALPAAEWSEVVRPFLNRGLPLRAFGQDLGPGALFGWRESPFTTTRRGKRGEPTLLGFAFPLGRTPGFGELRFASRRSDFVPVAGAASLAEVSFDLRPGAYAPISYGKTTLALATLEEVFGWDALREALREYVLRHRFTHPTGAQFLQALRDVIPAKTAAKEVELEPFLHELWRTAAVLDLAVAEARSVPHGEGFRTEVIVENRGTMRLPSRIRLRYADGREEWEPWPADRRFVAIERITSSRLVAAEVDPDRDLLVDVDWTNNGRTVERHDDLVRRFDAAALFWIEGALTFLRTLTGP